MAITGYLSELSLAELFQFLTCGQKTGMLTIRTLASSDISTGESYYIWFNQGRITGAANRLDGQGLLSLISQRGWLSDHAIVRLLRVMPVNVPLGIYLKSQGIFSSDKLKLLFSIQVLRQVCNLFTLSNAYFEFDSRAAIPATEMTGLSTDAQEVTLASLRNLRNWKALQNKLPEPTSALMNCCEGKPRLRLAPIEWHVWEFTNGTISLTEIAEHLRLSTAKIQQIAFRLMVVGLVEEVPIITANPPLSMFEHDELQEIEPSAEAVGAVSNSFLHNLMGFLKKQL